jgi:ribosomal protein S10
MSFSNQFKSLLKNFNKSHLNKQCSFSITGNKTTRTNNLELTDPKRKLVDFLNNNPASSSSNNNNLIGDFKFYDPPYLNKKPPFPNYELLNINIKGYDATSLQTCFKYIEKLCKSLKIEVVEAYCMPSRSYKIKTYQPFSTNLDKEYKLNKFHRVVKIQNLKSTLAPFLFETIQLNLPEGVQLSVAIPNKDEDEFRYVPDIELNELKEKYSEMSKKPVDELISKK